MIRIRCTVCREPKPMRQFPRPWPMILTPGNRPKACTACTAHRGAAGKANDDLQRLNAQLVALNEQIAAQPRLIAAAVDRARRRAQGRE